MSLLIDDVLSILKTHVSDDQTVRAIAKDLIKIEKEIKQANLTERSKPNKNRLVVLIRGDAPLKQLTAGGAYIVSVPDNDQTSTYSGDSLLARISSAARTFNDSLKRKKGNRAIRTFVQAMESLKSKAVKASGSSFLVKTKYPTEVVVVDKEDIL